MSIAKVVLWLKTSQPTMEPKMNLMIIICFLSNHGFTGFQSVQV